MGCVFAISESKEPEKARDSPVYATLRALVSAGAVVVRNVADLRGRLLQCLGRGVAALLALTLETSSLRGLLWAT